jgi:hypothetical protein
MTSAGQVDNELGHLVDALDVRPRLGAGSSAASMTPRWIPLLKATLPPARAMAVVSWLAAYCSASSSRPQNAVEAAQL